MTTEISEQQKSVKEQIQEKLQAAYALINECEELADQHKTSFSFSIEHGMGGTYQGDESRRWNSDYGIEGGWHPSSIGC